MIDFLTVDIDGLRVSVFVCYDLRFADEFWALAAEHRPLLVPANWPQPRHEHWRALLRARAIENQAYVVGVNRVGTVKDLVYSGDSADHRSAGPDAGRGQRSAGVLVADVDAAEVARVRAEFPFLADRRDRRLDRRLTRVTISFQPVRRVPSRAVIASNRSSAESSAKLKSAIPVRWMSRNGLDHG